MDYYGSGSEDKEDIEDDEIENSLKKQENLDPQYAAEGPIHAARNPEQDKYCIVLYLVL